MRLPPFIARKLAPGLGLALAGWGALAAQDIPPGPYSAGVGNASANAPDNPIPGFVDGQVNPRILGWASQVRNYAPANPAAIDSFWTNPDILLQPVTGNVFDVVSLGDLSASDLAKGVAPGSVVVSFDQPVGDGPGPDLAIFGNAFQLAHSTKVFAKLAYVEVSTDGVVFARFPSVDANPHPAGTSWPYVASDATKIYNLFGKAVNAYGSSWGNPFDLRDLTDHPLVKSGAVDLQNIRFVRLVAIPGSGAYQDSFGHPIYGPWPTAGSPGPEVQAVGILNFGHPGAAESPAPSPAAIRPAGGISAGSIKAAAIAPAKASAKANANGGAYAANAIVALANPVDASPDDSPPGFNPAGSIDAGVVKGDFLSFDQPLPPNPAAPSSSSALGESHGLGVAPPFAASPGASAAAPSPDYVDRSLTPTGLPVPAGTFQPTLWGRTAQRVAYVTGWEPTPVSAGLLLVLAAAALWLALRRRSGKN